MMRGLMKMVPTMISLRMLSKQRNPPSLQFTTSRLNWQASQSLRRQFTVSIHRLYRTPANPRVRASPKANQTPAPLRFSSIPLPPNTPRIVVGAVVGTCVSIFAWHSYEVREYRTKNSATARKNLEWYDQNLVLSMRNLHEGRYHTLLTSTLTHYNLTHLGFNMLALWGFGQVVVALYGVPTFAVLWVGSGIAGGLGQAYFWAKNPNPYVEEKAMGASGSLLGIFAALTCVMPKHPVSLVIIPMPMFVAAALTAGFSLGALKEGWLPYIGHADHLGGMAFGVLWWLVALRRRRIVGLWMR